MSITLHPAEIRCCSKTAVFQYLFGILKFYFILLFLYITHFHSPNEKFSVREDIEQEMYNFGRHIISNYISMCDDRVEFFTLLELRNCQDLQIVRDYILEYLQIYSTASLFFTYYNVLF